MGDTGMAIFCNDVDGVIQIVSVVSNGEKNIFYTMKQHVYGIFNEYRGHHRKGVVILDAT